MLTVTLPTAQMCTQIEPLPEGVRAVPWDLSEMPPYADAINAVLLPNYFDDNEGFARLSRLRHLSFVQLPSAGYDRASSRLPLDAVVANGRGIHDGETAELAVGLVLASIRGIDTAIRDMDSEVWRSQFRPSLAERKVLLIGYGAIGKAIADRLAPFAVEITAVARTARHDDGVDVHALDELATLLPQAEIVILTLPLTGETRGIVDAEFLAALRYGARLVNIGRGGLVDTGALVAELASRRIFAALDVTEPEPLPAGHPLWHSPNLILTPHIAGKTTATEARTLALYRRQIEALAEGRELENVIAKAN